MAIKTAQEHIRDIDKQRYARARERAKYEREREDLEYTADLRDDVMSLVRNSGLTFEEIHARCGPTPATLSKWMDKVTMRPQLAKMQAVLRILGKDMGIVESRRNSGQGDDRTTVRSMRVIK